MFKQFKTKNQFYYITNIPNFKKIDFHLEKK